jgi:hypothetical protein
VEKTHELVCIRYNDVRNTTGRRTHRRCHMDVSVEEKTSKPSPSVHSTGNFRSDHALKKPQHLSTCDREERESGEVFVSLL